MLSPKQRARLRRAPTVPNRVRCARRLAGLTQVQLAPKVPCSQANLSRIESGHYESLPLETTRALADIFGLYIEELFPAREQVSA